MEFLHVPLYLSLHLANDHTHNTIEYLYFYLHKHNRTHFLRLIKYVQHIFWSSSATAIAGIVTVPHSSSSQSQSAVDTRRRPHHRCWRSSERNREATATASLHESKYLLSTIHHCLYLRFCKSEWMLLILLLVCMEGIPLLCATRQARHKLRHATQKCTGKEWPILLLADCCLAAGC